VAHSAPSLSPVWTPRVPLVTAERHVDYARILDHILTRRRLVERTAAPVARRLGYTAIHQTFRPQALIDDLAARLERTLMATARFGYREARRELRSLRHEHPRPQRVTAAYRVPDAGQHGLLSLGGIDAIHRLIRWRARDTANAVAAAAAAAAQPATGADVPAAVKVAAAAGAATRTLHNYVLELVGETLNLGRTAGIVSLPEPPEFAMRSEQLDANTCDPCDELHGEIVEIGSVDYYELMPPNGCLGGGRCRGIYVYGDSADQVNQQIAA
jgi:hypothetical protein